MKMKMMKRALASLLAMATVLSVAAVSGVTAANVSVDSTVVLMTASTSAVTVTASEGYAEGAYAEWSAVSDATGYAVYANDAKVDSMLIRQYPGCFRVDVPGLKAGSYTLKIVPIIAGKEDGSKSQEVKVNVTAHDRSGFAFVNGTASGAYNDDGTLRDGAVVLYVTEDTKDTVALDVTTSDKGATTTATGIQNILTAYQKGYDSRPLCIRCIGNITDPATLMDGDLLIKGNGANKRLSCGITIEGIGNDTVFNGFGLRVANASNVEVRNIGFMNCNSGEGDNVGLQQNNDHVWVHHCDMFYGDAGSDADQIKGDGALDTKTSSYITHSYNHFWDNGKCNLQGMKSESTDNYVTYHHNWFDHSDSRHPRIRTCTVHAYNNYYDGNAKYGVGATMGCSVFVEANYFRNCKYPMLSSMQGSDIAYGAGTFSGEDGGIIKSFGNVMTGDKQKAYVTYQENTAEFDAYEAASRDEKVPDAVKTKQGGTSYSNFDTDASLMYGYQADPAEDVPAIVSAGAGRVQGGDFKWTFNNDTDDESYTVDQALKDALVAYQGTVVAIGSGFTDSTDPSQQPTTQPTEPTDATEPAPQPTDLTEPTNVPEPTDPIQVPSVNYTQVIYVSPNGTGSGKTKDDPTDVRTAINDIAEGGIIYLLEGTYTSDTVLTIPADKDGSAGKLKTMAAYPGAAVKFDFSSQPYEIENGKAAGSNQRGISLDADYWHLYGFEVYGAADNGIYVTGSNNIVEMVVLDGNRDTGLQISRRSSDLADMKDWPANNLIKNCTAYNNCDDATMENADGFAAKLTCGEGNVFDGCIAYNNSDDGWDLYAKEATGPIGVVTIRNCIAFRNGFTTDGRGYGDCDGNGFKLGGGGVGTRHVIENCLSFENLNCGFTDNNNPEFGVMKNCTAYNNNLGGNGKANYMVYRCSTTAAFDNMMSYYNVDRVTKTNAAGIKAGNDKFVGVMNNGIFYNGKYFNAGENVTMTNGIKLDKNVVTPADTDFIMLDVPDMNADFHKVFRNADGSPAPGGFAETQGTYAALGYHMASGMTQTATPVIGVPSDQDPVEPSTEPTDATEPSTGSGEPAGVTMYGDVDNDKDVDIMDVILLNRNLMIGAEVSEQGLRNADVDNSANVDAVDSLNILKAVVQLITLPV